MKAPPLRAAERHPAEWIENDGLLRDEGVLFGLAEPEGGGAALEDKLKAIDAYYGVRKAEAEAERARHRERLTVLETRAAELEALSSPELAPWPQHAIRVGLAALTAGLSYAVVQHLLSGSGLESPAVVAVAVVLAGLSGQFTAVSSLFTSEEARLTEPGAAEAWKVRLTEFGMPTVAALFAVTWGGARPWPQAATAFAFLMLVFLVAGRLALSGMPALWQALRVDRERRAEALAARTARAALTDEHERLRVALHSPASDEALDRRCDERKALFLSEVALARAARGTFGEDIGARVRMGGMADGVGGGVSGDGSADFEVPDLNTPDLGAADLGAPDEDAPTTDGDTVA